MPVIASALLLIFPVAMSFAAANDLFTMKIPNKISLALIAAFALAALYVQLPLETALLHLAIGVAALAAGFVMFSFRLLGGGDAKLMAAGALWMGPEHAILYIAYVTIFGGLLSAAILAYRKYVPVSAEALPPWAVKLHVQGTGIPYGIAIAASGLVMYPSTIWYHALLG
ncbi:MAG: prepilin peptidase [Hyphomicrobium sp.]|nr:peptidase [Hyphomicrobium sp.]